MSNTTVSTTTIPARTIGPVTTASGGGVAVSIIITWLVQIVWGVTIPPEVQGSVALVLVIIAGFLVRPHPVISTLETAAADTPRHSA